MQVSVPTQDVILEAISEVLSPSDFKVTDVLKNRMHRDNFSPADFRSGSLTVLDIRSLWQTPKILSTRRFQAQSYDLRRAPV